MRLANGFGKSCKPVVPWGMENDFLHVAGLKVLVEMSRPGGVDLRELSAVDYSVRQCLLSLWLSRECPLPLTSQNTFCGRRYKLNP